MEGTRFLVGRVHPHGAVVDLARGGGSRSGAGGAGGESNEQTAPATDALPALEEKASTQRFTGKEAGGEEVGRFHPSVPSPTSRTSTLRRTCRFDPS